MIWRMQVAWMVAGLLFSAASTAWGQVWFDDARVAATEEFLAENFSKQDSDAGMVVGIVDDQGTRILAAGILDNGTDRKVDGNTIFEIGSVTKTMTTLLLLEMSRRGEIDPNDPVENHLPPGVRMPARGNKKITLLHLAAQESGLPFNQDNLADKFWVDAYNEYTVEDLYAFLNAYELQVDPGLQFEYSNVGFTLLGHVMERKTGRPFESLVRERICEPLGMNDTRITITSDLEPRVAMGHDREGKRAPKYQLQVIAPAGALLSTAHDLLRYLSANLGMLETDLYRLMQRMQRIRHQGSTRFGNGAMPWFDEGIYHPPGSRLLGHAGGTPGCASFIGLDVKQRRGVVVLSSQTTIRPAAIGWRLLQGMPLSTDNSLVRRIVGIGAALETDEETGLVRITKVFDGSPASAAELAAGQLIRAVNGVSVVGKSAAQCIGLMKGPEGTAVRLELAGADRDVGRVVTLRKSPFLTK